MSNIGSPGCTLCLRSFLICSRSIISKFSKPNEQKDAAAIPPITYPNTDELILSTWEDRVKEVIKISIPRVFRCVRHTNPSYSSITEDSCLGNRLFLVSTHLLANTTSRRCTNAWLKITLAWKGVAIELRCVSHGGLVFLLSISAIMCMYWSG
jgi:hypothetical protein